MSKTLKSLLILFAVLLIGAWLYNKYDERIFLRYGILKIDRYPESMEMLEYKTEGASDFHAEYTVTVERKDFDKLLTGRSYFKEDAYSAVNLSVPFDEPHTFEPRYRYYSGSIGNGITILYVNADYTKVFIDYWVD